MWCRNTLKDHPIPVEIEDAQHVGLASELTPIISVSDNEVSCALGI